MILYEYEGKELLASNGLKRPDFELLTNSKKTVNLKAPFFLKAQVLSGKRAVQGGIVKVEDSTQVSDLAEQMFSREVNGEKVEKILVEKSIEIEKEYYVSFSYDTSLRGAVMSFSDKGGTGIEERGIKTVLIDPLDYKISENFGLPSSITESLIKIFFQSGCLLLEINPLVYGSENGGDKSWFVLDAKIKLDDSASGRHPEWRNYPPRFPGGRHPSQREIAAHKIDEGDYHGTAGATYLDLEGDIGVLASGGGASLVAMDALVASGGRPANYTEYSGNPSREKVEKLAEVVLSNPNLSGLWIVGAVANFTDIYETMSGIISALRNIRDKTKQALDFPIVIRRGGPRDTEAFEMLREVKDFDLHIYGPEISIPQSAQVIIELAEKYRSKK